jgi:Rieske 2Fe-2S family protein
MPVQTGTAIDELIAQYKRGFSLEQPFYVDPSVFERNLARIFWWHGLFVNHA